MNKGRGLQRRLIGVVLLGVIVAVACENGGAPTFPSGATQFQARPEYALWWRITEQCSGLTGSMANIEWFGLPGNTYTYGSDSLIEGTWFESSSRMLLAQNSIDYGPTVRHEMLHALDHDRGPGHSPELFRVRCGGYVSCPGPCATEVGSFPDPPSDAPVVTPKSLIVSVAADPADITDATDGWTVVTVSVTNPFPYPVWVSLATPYTNLAQTFGFGMGDFYPFPGIGATDEIYINRMGFAGNETKLHAFDAWVGSGNFTVKAWGFFNSDTTPLITVTRH